MKIIDLHCDTIAKLHQDGNVKLSCNSFAVDIEKLKTGESLAQFFALFIDQAKVDDPLLAAKNLLALFYREMDESRAKICLAKNDADLSINHSENKISAFLTIEEGGVLQGKIENLLDFYQLGVRLITLTWNYPNEIGYPNHHYQYRDFGLTGFGRECVAKMNALGMIVDVSHLSDRGFYDVAKISVKPFVASHSNSRAVCAHSRNLTDDMIKILAEKGGVMGLNFAAHFLGEGDLGKIDDMMHHLKHIYRIGGIDVIALGTDFDGISTAVEIGDFSQMQRLVEALRCAGFNETEIEKITYKNARRVIVDCLGI